MAYNRLANETSPYLLQHKSNPVDWYPWSDEALARAKRENKPILLSIGYSACHWCHVMEHESFENPQIAEVMNEHFVNIKVDREERPDLDQIYQNVAQAMTQSGGWPLTVFLTPELKPFYGGTYFPPDDRYGRPGFGRLLTALAGAYEGDSQGVRENSEKLVEYISHLESLESGERRFPQLQEFRQTIDQLLSYVDWEEGGLGGAPKFPSAMTFTYLWRYGILSGLDKSRDAAILSLRKMASGGIYDHLGGGFHRYSVDAAWSVPHFEKMLYDNGLLLKLYAEVLLTDQLSSEANGESGRLLNQEDRKLFLNVLSETVQYVLREMTSPEGVFYTAQDADSEGEEGKYFVWDQRDLSEILDSKEDAIFSRRYGITSTGNFEHGKTVLFLAQDFDTITRQTGVSAEEAEKLIASAKRKLLAAREKRIAPGLDHKVIASWNGLMISGMVWASQALIQNGINDLGKQAEAAAVKAFRFLKTNLAFGSDRLHSTFQGGQGKHNGYLDDYAFLALGALDLARFGHDYQENIQQAKAWVDAVLKHFKDQNGVGYFFTSDDHEKLIHRPKSFSDQAIPSGSSIVLQCLLILQELGVGGPSYSKEVEDQLGNLFVQAEKMPYGMGEFLNFGMMATHGLSTITGPADSTLILHPYFYPKPSDSNQSGWVVCQRQACSLTLKDRASVIQNLVGRLKILNH